MTTATLAMPLRAGTHRTTTRGVSADAQVLVERSEEWLRERLFGRALHNWDAVSELMETFEDAAVPNWDGFGARPVALATLEKAKAFLAALPPDMPSPEISADPDGEIAFDWTLDRDWTMAVSLGPDGRLSHAGLYGPSRAYGTEEFVEEIPRTVLRGLERLFARRT